MAARATAARPARRGAALALLAATAICAAPAASCDACDGEPTADSGPDAGADGGDAGWADGGADGGGSDSGPVDSGTPITCMYCHGGAGSAAPPPDTQWHTSTRDRGVGAHRSHVGASDWHRGVACTECHLVPLTWSWPGHYDTPLPAEVTFGPLASAAGAEPTWDGERCSGVYCHGATLAAWGAATEPFWTEVGLGQAACGGACHLNPPAGPHPLDGRCERCHGMVVAADLSFLRPELHIDGVCQFSAPR